MNGQLLEQRLLVPLQEVVAPFDEFFAAPVRAGSDAGVSRRSAARRSRWRRAARPSTFTRAAASSIASGNPSTRRVNLGSERDGLGIGLESGRAARARRGRSSTAAASSGVYRESHLARDVERPRGSSPGSGPGGHSRGPVTRSAQPRSSTCSHASRIRSAAPWRSREVTRASGSGPRTSTACARRRTASSAPPARAKSTSQMPSGTRPRENARDLDGEADSCRRRARR